MDEAKVILLGEANTGKSSLLMRFLRDRFVISKPTVAPEFAVKTVEAGRRKVKIKLWDIAGQERFRSVARSYYRNASGCLLVCDQSQRESFEKLRYWLSELGDPIPTLLICNKSDQDSVLSDQELDQFCSQHQLIGWVRVSARTGENVQRAFQMISAQLESKPIQEPLPIKRRYCW